MSNLQRVAVVFLVMVSFAVPALCASKCQPEFDSLKSLAGDWLGTKSDGSPVHVNYRLVSGGSVVMESIQEPSGGQMVTLYHLDGDTLMMTHYCLANNQPRMRADAATSTPKAIKFSFVDVTNLASPAAGHMYGHSIAWKDADHVSQQWTWRENGHDTTETFELQRQK
jgi:hypothetical protein